MAPVVAEVLMVVIVIIMSTIIYVCVITASVHNVFVMTGANLTVVSATINGDLIGNYSRSITLRNANVYGWTGLYNVQATNISGSSLNTSGNLSYSHDGCCSAMYG